MISKALGDIAPAKGMSQVARDSDASRESLYMALMGERTPSFDTILQVIAELGLRLQRLSHTNLLGGNRLIEQITRPNALFLSAAVQLRHEQLAPLYSWFRHLNAVNVPGRRPSALRFAGHQLIPREIEAWLGQNPQQSLFAEDEAQSHRVNILRTL